MPIKVLLGVVLALTIGCGFLFWRTIQANKAVAALEVEREVLQQSIQTLQDNAAQVDEALLESRRARDELEKLSRQWGERYEDVLRKDAEARAWADGAVPNSVVELLREHPDGKDTTDNATGSAPGAGDGTDVQRRNKR